MKVWLGNLLSIGRRSRCLLFLRRVANLPKVPEPAKLAVIQGVSHNPPRLGRVTDLLKRQCLVYKRHFGLVSRARCVSSEMRPVVPTRIPDSGPGASTDADR